jgi:hypothetical protein
MTALLVAARNWVDHVHPHARHLLRTEDWLVTLDPAATEGLRLAATLHDIERAFPDPDATWDSARDWDSPDYNRWHQDRCADIAARWLREQGAEAALVDEVEALVGVHEDGGWREADLVQAADSLSFLETMVPLVLTWVDRGYGDNAEAKLQHSLDRIDPGLDSARLLAAPMLEQSLAELARVRAGAAR